MSNTPLNPDDEARLKKALEQSANGQVVSRGSFAQYAQNPLNPEALRVATTAAHDAVDWQMYDVTKFDLEDSVDVATIAAVSAYLAVAQPVVTSVEELEALPIGSIIAPFAYDEPTALLRDQFGTWAVAGLPEPFDTEKIHRALQGKGARVVYIPEVKP